MEYTITPLLVGLRESDQGILTYQRNYGNRIWLPIWSFLVQGNGKNILVDTGLDYFSVTPEFVTETGLKPKNISEALKDLGLETKDIDIVINTHLHDDHCANNPLFENAKFFIQKKEIESCKNPHPLDQRYEADFIQDLNIVEVEGDLEPVPGIKLIFTPGHTPGSQTIAINTAHGTAIIPGFCSNKDNFPARGPAPCPGVHCDAYQAYDTAQRVKSMGAIIFPLHEINLAKLNGNSPEIKQSVN